METEGPVVAPGTAVFVLVTNVFVPGLGTLFWGILGGIRAIRTSEPAGPVAVPA